jgi:hypothetical protein
MQPVDRVVIQFNTIHISIPTWITTVTGKTEYRNGYDYHTKVSPTLDPEGAQWYSASTAHLFSGSNGSDGEQVIGFISGPLCTLLSRMFRHTLKHFMAASFQIPIWWLFIIMFPHHSTILIYDCKWNVSLNTWGSFSVRRRVRASRFVRSNQSRAGIKLCSHVTLPFATSHYF